MYSNLSRAELSRSRMISGMHTHKFIAGCKAEMMEFEQAVRRMKSNPLPDCQDLSALSTTASTTQNSRVPKIQKMKTVDGTPLPAPFRRNLESNPKYMEILQGPIISVHSEASLKDSKPTAAVSVRLKHSDERERQRSYLRAQMSYIKSKRINLFIQKESFEHLQNPSVAPPGGSPRSSSDVPLSKLKLRVAQFSAGLDYALSTLKTPQIIQAMRKLRAIPQPPVKLSMNQTMLKKSERTRNYNLILKNSFQPVICVPKPPLEVSMGKDLKSEGSKTKRTDSKHKGKVLLNTVITEEGVGESLRSGEQPHSIDEPSGVSQVKQMFNQTTPTRPKQASFSQNSATQMFQHTLGSQTQRRTDKSMQEWNITLLKVNESGSKTTPNVFGRIQIGDMEAQEDSIRPIDVSLAQVRIPVPQGDHPYNVSPNFTEESVSFGALETQSKKLSKHSNGKKPPKPETSASRFNPSEVSHERPRTQILRRQSKASKSSQSQDVALKLLSENHKQSLEIQHMIDDIVLNRTVRQSSASSWATVPVRGVSKDSKHDVKPFTINKPSH